MTVTFDNIAAVIENARNIVIATHIRPDGDCLGSTLALARYIERFGGKQVHIWNADADTVVQKFRYLPGLDKVVSPSNGKWNCDLAITLDTSTRKRLGRTWECIADIPTILNIDHHGDNSVEATLNYIDPTAPATGQIIYEFFHETGVSIDSEMATCLFAAISTDTGSFQYRGTDKRTFLAAAALVEAGVDVAALSIAMYDSQPKRQFDLLCHALNETHFLCDDRFAYFALRLADTMGLQPEDTEGIVDRLRAVESVVCAAFFEEQSDGCVRVSTRSKDLSVNVSEICRAFGGGGHPLAAGARVRGSLDKVVEQFSQAICHAISQRNH